MMSPLNGNNLKESLPEAVINIFNKIYSRRFDFDRQVKKYGKDKLVFEQNLARVDAKLNLMQTLNGKVWQDAIENQMKQSVETKREFVQDKVRARLEKEVNEQ